MAEDRAALTPTRHLAEKPAHSVGRLVAGRPNAPACSHCELRPNFAVMVTSCDGIRNVYVPSPFAVTG